MSILALVVFAPFAHGQTIACRRRWCGKFRANVLQYPRPRALLKRQTMSATESGHRRLSSMVSLDDQGAVISPVCPPFASPNTGNRTAAPAQRAARSGLNVCYVKYFSVVTSSKTLNPAAAILRAGTSRHDLRVVSIAGLLAGTTIWPRADRPPDKVRNAPPSRAESRGRTGGAAP